MTSAIDFYSSGKKICYFSMRFRMNSSRDVYRNPPLIFCAGMHSTGFSGPEEIRDASEQRENKGECCPRADIVSYAGFAGNGSAQRAR
jgi:hypothetical protein